MPLATLCIAAAFVSVPPGSRVYIPTQYGMYMHAPVCDAVRGQGWEVQEGSVVSRWWEEHGRAVLIGRNEAGGWGSRCALREAGGWAGFVSYILGILWGIRGIRCMCRWGFRTARPWSRVVLCVGSAGAPPLS